MPIIDEGPPAWSSILAGLIGGAGNYIGARNQAKQQQQDKANKDKAQAAALALQKARLGIDASNAGMTYDPASGDVKPWTPPPAAPTATPPTSNAPGTPQTTQGAGAPPAGPTASSGPSSPPTGTGGASSDLTQQAALAKQMVASQMGIYQSEAQQVQTLTAQGAPRVLIEQHRKSAQDALTEAGQWTGRQQAAEKAIVDAQKAAQVERTQAFESKLKYPPGWSKMAPQQQIAYLQQRVQAALQNGDKEVASATNAEIGRLQRQISEENTARHQQALEAQGQQRLDQGMTRIGQAADRLARSWSNKALTPYEKAELDLQTKRFDAEFPGGKKPGSTKVNTPDARAADQAAAEAAIAKGADRDAVVRRYAAKWGLTPDKADALFP